MNASKLTVAFVLLMGAVILSGVGLAQSRRPASPAGASATEIGGRRRRLGGRTVARGPGGRPSARSRPVQIGFADASVTAPRCGVGANVSRD